MRQKTLTVDLFGCLPVMVETNLDDAFSTMSQLLIVLAVNDVMGLVSVGLIDHGQAAAMLRDKAEAVRATSFPSSDLANEIASAFQRQALLIDQGIHDQQPN